MDSKTWEASLDEFEQQLAALSHQLARTKETAQSVRELLDSVGSSPSHQAAANSLKKTAQQNHSNKAEREDVLS